MKDSSAPTTVERLAFIVWQQETMVELSMAEKAAELMFDLDELNELQSEGDESEVTAMREEMLAKYRDIGLLEIHQDNDFWATKMHPLSKFQDIDEPIL